MKKISILILCALIAGCSVFKKSTKKKQVDTEKKEMRDILTSTSEEIEITIPPNLFARIYGKDIDVAPRPEKETSKDSTREKVEETSNPTEVSGPVKIRINRKTKTQDNTTIKTDKEETSTKQEVTEKKTKDLIGGFKWFILIGGVVVIGIAIVVIKFYF